MCSPGAAAQRAQRHLLSHEAAHGGGGGCGSNLKRILLKKSRFDTGTSPIEDPSSRETSRWFEIDSQQSNRHLPKPLLSKSPCHAGSLALTSSTFFTSIYSLSRCWFHKLGLKYAR